MMYIPGDWLNNPNNEKEVRDLISACTGCLHLGAENTSKEMALARLKELGEDRILQELNSGSFAS